VQSTEKQVTPATAADAMEASSLIVASVPFKNYKDLSADALAGKIVIDTLNYYPERDGIMSEVKTESITESELLRQHLSKSTVIKAINNMDWIRLLTCARPKNAPDRSALPIAGDDVKAVAVVSEFIKGKKPKGLVPGGGC
jgi:predicted dinucleotide-binding enzyme